MEDRTDENVLTNHLQRVLNTTPVEEFVIAGRFVPGNNTLRIPSTGVRREALYYQQIHQ
jgi:hypothetical protein